MNSLFQMYCAFEIVIYNTSEGKKVGVRDQLKKKKLPTGFAISELIQEESLK